MKKLLLSSIIMFGVCTFASAQTDRQVADKQAKAQTAARPNSISTATGATKPAVVNADAADIAEKQAAKNAAASDVASPSQAVSATSKLQKQAAVKSKQTTAAQARQATDAQAKKTNDN